MLYNYKLNKYFIFYFKNLHIYCTNERGQMKRIFLIFVVPLFLTGCFQMVALLPSVITGVTTGNTLHAGLSIAINTGVKETTGLTPMEHIISYTFDNDRVIEELNKDLQNAFSPINTVLD